MVMTAYWIECVRKKWRRHVIVRQASDGTVCDITPKDFYARTTVHEYGGGAFVVDSGVIYFSNYKDQRLYRQLDKSVPLFNQCR